VLGGLLQQSPEAGEQAWGNGTAASRVPSSHCHCSQRDCRQHCLVLEIISSEHTWLMNLCLTASSIRQFVQYENVSEHLSLKTCKGVL